MFELLLTAILIPGCWAGAGYFIFRKKWGRRIEVLERELRQLSEAMCEMAETQMKAYEKVTINMGHIEERMLDLSVPSSDSPPPLERRHHVLALANRGVALDEIVTRLKIPRGEAELILGLRKYAARTVRRETVDAGEVKRYVQA